MNASTSLAPQQATPAEPQTLFERVIPLQGRQPLPSPRDERFSQLIVHYRSHLLLKPDEEVGLGEIRLRAYREAGFGKASGARGTSDIHNARRLANRPDIRVRVSGIMFQEAEHIGASAGAIIHEMCKLGFANIAEVLKTDEHGNLRPMLDTDRTISKNFAAAIAEVGFDSKGRPKVKMHDKAGILRDLAKIFELFRDGGDTNVQVNNIGLGDRLDSAIRRLTTA